MQPLDRPIWHALQTAHAGVSLGDARARRYHPAVAPMAATADDSVASLEALGRLAGPGESLLLLMADPIVGPRGLEVVTAAPAVQMLAAQPGEPCRDTRIAPLGWDDAEAMLGLAELTRPGPFSLKALSLGGFWGIKAGSTLIAMAGERMKLPGYTELSGVCTHPDHRGKGLGRLLSRHVMQVICDRGEKPFLHAYASNAAAIALYESIGFHIRSAMHVAMLRRPA